MPRVSVVIPTYNRAYLLREAVVSVLNQTYQDLELIVVDDGSTDNTPEMAGGFKDPRVRYIYQENQGVSAARNTGIIASEGEYIVVMGSDNILTEDALEKSIAFMDCHPDVGFCIGQFYTMDDCGKPLRVKKTRGPQNTFVRNGRDEIAHLLFSDHALACFFLVRSSCYEHVGLYDTRLRMSEDWDMWFRLSKHYDVGYLAEPLVIVRYHPQSLTAKSKINIIHDTHAFVLESVFADPELGPIFRHLRRKAYFGLYCLCAREAAFTGHKIVGLWFVLKAFGIAPGMLLERKGISLLMRSGKNFLPWPVRMTIVKLLMASGLR